jgi:hypothetical protein
MDKPTTNGQMDKPIIGQTNKWTSGDTEKYLDK